MKFSVIVTLGPSIEDQEILKAISACGPVIFRLNGAHLSGKSALNLAISVREIIPNAKILLDLPGNKIRTTKLDKPIPFEKGVSFELPLSSINYAKFNEHIKVGDVIRAHDSVYALEVISIKSDSIEFISQTEGSLESNKGLHLQGINNELPFLFNKDVELLEAASSFKADYIGLSFVRNAADIIEAKNICADMSIKSELIAKVETKSAANNLGHILSEVDNILIDRGDLSSDVGIFELPAYQERIISAAQRAGKNVYLATQFLKNMETSPVPLIAEIIDLDKTVRSGIHGIQLSEETAVGKYPLECVEHVFKVYYQSFAG